MPERTPAFPSKWTLQLYHEWEESAKGKEGSLGGGFGSTRRAAASQSPTAARPRAGGWAGLSLLMPRFCPLDTGGNPADTRRATWCALRARSFRAVQTSCSTGLCVRHVTEGRRDVGSRPSICICFGAAGIRVTRCLSCRVSTATVHRQEPGPLPPNPGHGQSSPSP